VYTNFTTSANRDIKNIHGRQ